MTQTPEPVTVDLLLPPAMARLCEQIGLRKANLDAASTFVLAVLAGAFIALGAMLFTVVVTGSGLGFGPTRLVGGIAFSLGLILVVIGGAELFTGNTLIVMAWASRLVSTRRLLRNWAIVYVGNFAGAAATAGLVFASGQWKLSSDAVGGTAVRIAAGKTALDFGEAVALGVLCNVLVTLAVWLTFSGRSTVDKIAAIVFPITAFVAAGFEHSVANMYFLPLGLLLKGEPRAVTAAALGDEGVSGLTVADALLNNLLPVTIGNVIGGALLVAGVYWFVYLRPRKTPAG